MAHLLGAEALHLEFPTKVVFDSVTLGLNEGDRVGIVGRNGDGKSSLLAMLAGRLQPNSGRVTVRGGVTVGVLGQADALDDALTVEGAVVGDTPEHVLGRRRPRAGRDPRPAGRRPLGRAGRHAQRRPAAPGRAGRAAHRGVGRPAARRADQPPRRRGDHLARGPPQAALGAQRRRPRRRHPRSLVPRRGVQRHLGGPRPDRRAVRGRLRRLHPAAGGARPDGRLVRGETAEPRAQGTRLAAPRRAGPHVQAQVPHRRGQRAHRRRARDPRQGIAAVPGRRPARQGRR